MTDKEKLDRLKKLADAMYTAAQYLTTDASGLRKAMDEYHRFIIYEYNKQEPVSEDLEQASKEWLRPQLDKSYANYGERKMMELTHFDGYAMLDAIEFGAQWKREKMMNGAVEGHVERGYCEDGISEHFEVFAYLGGRDERFKDLNDGQSVKVIIIKE